MRQLGVFAKYWQPGAVKTRLASSIGSQAAAQVHRQCVQVVLARLGAAADRRVLMVTPPEKLAEFASMAGPQWRVEPQSAGDLGARMRHYFETSFAGGATKVVLVGSDSPTLPLGFVERAFESLGRRAVVIGPANDGGYYLVGAADQTPPIFEGVTWGSNLVWRQTIERLNAARFSFAKLPRWYDVDTFDDLRQLRAELAELNPRDEVFEGLWREIEATSTEWSP